MDKGIPGPVARGVRALLLGLAFLIASSGAMAAPRSAETVTIEGGRYVALAPQGWDGTSRLPLLLYLHGYADSPSGVLADKSLTDAVSQAKFLLILPEGEHGTWTFHGSPQTGRDDIAFVHRVVADAERRYPIDRTRVVAAGFSIGGSVVWDLACHSPDGFVAFLPVAGTFWLPYPERCEGGAVNLRHVHGRDDHTFPLAGRRIGVFWRQGDSRKSLEMLKDIDACPAEPDRKVMEEALGCEIWTGCGSGKQIQFCLHDGDHYVAGAFLAPGLAWALSLPPVTSAADGRG